MRGARDIAFGIPFLERMHAIEIDLPVRQGARLVAGRRTDLRNTRPRMEIGVGFGLAYFLERTFYADLAPEAFPVEQQRGTHVGADLLTLAAFGIGVEHETVGSVALEQNHAHGREAIFRRGCQCHRVGIVGLGLFCFRVPHFEQHEGIAGGNGAVVGLHAKFPKGSNTVLEQKPLRPV